MASGELPYGYQDDDVFDSLGTSHHSEESDSMSCYSSDDGGDGFIALSPLRVDSPPPLRSLGHGGGEQEASFLRHKVGEWNEKFQQLVERTYFHHDVTRSAEQQHALTITLRQLSVRFAEEASAIGVQIVQEMVGTV